MKEKKQNTRIYDSLHGNSRNDSISFCLQSAVLFAIPWTIGAVVDVDGRHKFDAFYKELVGGHTEDAPLPKAVGKLEVPLPNDSVYDIYFEVRNCLSCVMKKFVLIFSDQFRQNLASSATETSKRLELLWLKN